MDLLLFAEPSVKQVQVIRETVNTLSAASRLRLSEAKTIMWFLKNVDADNRSHIQRCSPCSVTNDLGRYLGVPIIHGRVTKQTYYKLVEKVKARLNGWTASTLSMAGRVTLIKPALTVIPWYTMQTTKIPLAILNEVERLCSNFLWGAYC